MMFISLVMSSFFSMLQQRQARGAEEGNVGPITPRRRGLTRRVIDSLPVKHYDANVAENNNESEGAESECCPICLVGTFFLFRYGIIMSIVSDLDVSKITSTDLKYGACHADMR